MPLESNPMRMCRWQTVCASATRSVCCVSMSNKAASSNMHQHKRGLQVFVLSSPLPVCHSFCGLFHADPLWICTGLKGELRGRDPLNLSGLKCLTMLMTDESAASDLSTVLTRVTLSRETPRAHTAPHPWRLRAAVSHYLHLLWSKMGVSLWRQPSSEAPFQGSDGHVTYGLT